MPIISNTPPTSENHTHDVMQLIGELDAKVLAILDEQNITWTVRKRDEITYIKTRDGLRFVLVKNGEDDVKLYSAHVVSSPARTVARVLAYLGLPEQEYLVSPAPEKWDESQAASAKQLSLNSDFRQ